MQYDRDGTIRSSDATFDNQLNQVLNLNLAALKNRRKVDIRWDYRGWWKEERAKLREASAAREDRTQEGQVYGPPRGSNSPAAKLQYGY